LTKKCPRERRFTAEKGDCGCDDERESVGRKQKTMEHHHGRSW